MIEFETSQPNAKGARKKQSTGTAVQLAYRIAPNTSGVSAARIEVWDRPDLLAKIPVKVSKNGQFSWADTSTPTPSRLDFALVDPDASKLCGHTCDDHDSPQLSPVTVGGDDVPPSFLSDPVRVRAGSETLTLDLKGRFFTPGTKVLLAEPTSKIDVWKAWEFLTTDFVDSNQVRVTVPWTYLASPRKLVLWPFSLDEADAAQRNGLPLNGTEQKPPVGGGSQEIIFVASPSSPALSELEPGRLAADDSGHGEALVTLRGSGFSSSSLVLIGRSPLAFGALDAPISIAPKYLSATTLEVHIPGAQLRFPDLAYSRLGPLRIWVRNGTNALEISEARDLEILPTAKLPAPSRPGVILDISPRPLALIPVQGPSEVEVTVSGRDFRPNDSIEASVDGERKAKLPTKFISSTELHVLLPRSLWREHRLSYRFVIETADGERATGLYEDGESADP